MTFFWEWYNKYQEDRKREQHEWDIELNEAYYDYEEDKKKEMEELKILNMTDEEYYIEFGTDSEDEEYMYYN